jgi:hypothetical protein
MCPYSTQFLSDLPSFHFFQMSLSTSVSDMFTRIANDPDKYPSDWKHMVMNLSNISNTTRDFFSEDAREGFNYLAEVVYCTICDKCNDEKAFVWLKTFARAWIHQEELPKFPTSCYFSESDTQS